MHQKVKSIEIQFYEYYIYSGTRVLEYTFHTFGIDTYSTSRKYVPGREYSSTTRRPVTA